MDFIKKHYEKIALALALLILIGSALFLYFKVSSLTEEVQGAPYQPKPKGGDAQPTDLSQYTNAMASLQQPAQWSEHEIDPFRRLGGPGGTTESTNPVVPQTEPVVLLDVHRELFKLKFVSYSGAGENFQLNFSTRARTFFVPKVGLPVEGMNEQTGYVITKFEPKTCTNNVPGIGAREVDCSELTLQHEREDPIVLVLDKVAEEREPVATLQCTAAGGTLPVRRQQTFDCGGQTYNVVDILPKQVIIADIKSKEKRILNLRDQSGTPHGTP
jgi:hypothetical protein